MTGHSHRGDARTAADLVGVVICWHLVCDIAVRSDKPHVHHITLSLGCSFVPLAVAVAVRPGSDWTNLATTARTPTRVLHPTIPQDY